MSRKIKNEQKKFLGETLNQYDKALSEAINQLDKKNREQNHKISSLVNSFDNEYLEKDVEGNMTTLENSKDGMVIINEIQGNTEVNYCKDGEKELILNGDIDTQGKSFVTITEGVNGGLVDVSLEGNTEINLSKTKDPVLVTREFDDINCNAGKLQYTIDDVTTINDEPGKVDIDRIVGDTMVNHAVNGSEELILNAHIDKSGDNNITLNGITSDGGKVDVYLEGNTLVNVSNVKDDYITPTIEDKVDQGSVISLPEVSEGLVNIDEIEGNTLVNYCTDGAKELTLNGDIDVEGNFVTTTEGSDNGLVDVMCEGNTLVNCIQPLTSSSDFDAFSGTIEDGYLCFNANGKFKNYFVKKGKFIVKPSTTYTFVVDIKENTLVNETTSNCFTFGDSLPESPTYWTKTYWIKTGTIGRKVFTLTTKDSFGNVIVGDRGYIDAACTGGNLKFKYMILEGDWTDKEIPEYFEGMKSVGQDDENGHKVEIVSQNKNLINGNELVEKQSGVEYTYKDNMVYINGTTVRNYENSRYVSIKNMTPGETYTLSYETNNEDKAMAYPVISYYDMNAKKTAYHTKNVTFTWQSYYQDAKVYIQVDSAGLTFNNIWYKVQLEKTTSATSYTPHAKNKKEILLNEPLRSLPNGVKDRFVKIGGKWFIERNCGEVVLDGSNYTPKSIPTSIDNKKRWVIYQDSSIKNMPSSQVNTINDRYFNATSGNTWGASLEGICQNNMGNTILLYLERYSDGSDESKQALISELQQNPVTVAYQLTTPVYEPLEIEPTLNTYNDITHISNNSIIPCNMQIKNTGYNAIIKPSTLYTVAVDTDKSGTIGINLAGAKVTTTNNVATVTTPETLTDDSLRLYGKGIKGSKVRLLEGDKTNWIPSFFEGMKSSFEDKVQEDGSYKMEIVSNNKNLFDISNTIVVGNNDADNNHTLELGVNNGIKLTSIRDHQGWVYSMLKLPNLKPNTNYTFRCNITKNNPNQNSSIRIFRTLDNSDYGIMRESGSITFKTPIVGVEQLILLVYSSKDNIPTNQGDVTYFEDIQISEVVSDFIPHKSNKIQLSSIKPLRGINEIHDRLVFKDGKLMIERNCIELIYDGTENWTWQSVQDSNCTSYYTPITNKNIVTMQKILCNILPYKDSTTGGASGGKIFVYTSKNLNVIIEKNKLSSVSVDGFKDYLRTNNLKVVIPLNTPTYEEIPYDFQKIILESYNNGTLFIDTNIPPTKISFNCFEEELTYLYPSTSYTVQFVSDRTTTADITLGGTQLLAQSIVAGLNRISITTPTTLTDNKLIINGVGAKINEVVVTDTNREFKYFEGMKSVGENGLKIYSGKPQRFGKGGRI